ncbi:MAG: MotA/TolQ/ExbB proton channel family protein [Marinilabiliaceae bacterium]|nr:MotA/TolQ/ExbB proton channel family protein [Marinilabiliaceae bacterium]
MKRVFAFIAILGMLSFGASIIYAQDENIEEASEEVTDEVAEEAAETAETAEFTSFDSLSDEDEDADADAPIGIHKQLKIKYIEGGAMFMSLLMMCLVFGLAISIERIIYLNLSSGDTKRFITGVEEALGSGGIDAAKELCRNTRGPIASIYYQGLDRFDEGLEVVEKSITAYGSVQTGLLEKGLSWISLFISIAPMLGFMGTVLGMIMAFDNIQAMGDISPTAVAGGMKLALITTVGGLVVAVILQIFYNYILSKIDSLIIEMEDSSVSLMDILIKYNLKK